MGDANEKTLKECI